MPCDRSVRSLGVLLGLLSIAGSICSLSGAESLTWKEFPGYRIASLPPSEESSPGFTLISAQQAGIEFKNELSNQRSLERRGLLSGSGVAAGDVDGDGWCDLYFCGLDGSNQLYRNLGDWRFELMPPSGGIDCANTDSTAAALADIDGDKDLDLVVSASGHGVRLFLNNGRGSFWETTHEAGLASRLGSMSIALADVDGDQDLDLYVANFRPTTIMDEASTRFQGRNINGVPTVTHVNGQPTTLPLYTNRFVISPTRKILELGQVDQLFLNDGTGKFSERSFTSGAFFDENGDPLKEPPRDWGLAVQMRDFTGDGAPDIYVCNDLYTPDRIWINRGDGTFKALEELALRNTSTFSMGSDFADIDRDGDLDFFVVDMLSPDHAKRHVQVNMTPPRPNAVGQFANRQQILRNTLQLNLGDNTYAEISQLSGVEATDWSWGPIFLDVDLDGYEDILVTNGQLRDFQNVDHARRLESIRQNKKVSISEFRALINEYPNLSTPNFAYRNFGNLKFEDTSKSWGFDQNGISQGMALADLDNDGDADVIQNNLLTFPNLLRNNTSAPRIRVQLRGLAPNTRGIGARVEVTGGRVPQSQEILAAGRYLSSDQAMRTFAGNPSGDHVTIKVTWRSGKVSLLENIPNQSLCEIFESASTDELSSSEQAHGSPIQFTDISDRLQHQHKDTPFNDMERQPLLPNRLSQAGPPAAWIDLDGDSWEDLIIGAGRGGALAAFMNDGQGHFKPKQQRLTRIPSSRDYTTLLPWGPERRDLLVGLSNYEDGVASGDAVSLLQLQDDKIRSLINAQAFSFGCLTAADWDQDGDLDLFISGRVHAGKYPQPVDSLFYKNENGTLQKAHTFESLGLVTGALFSDLNGDGSPELIVTREWGSLKIFTGSFGAIRDVTQEWKVEGLSGWWNGVTAGDFNGDGRMDLIATNWGRNHKFEVKTMQPLKLYYGDMDQNGTMDLVESYIESSTQQELPVRSLRSVGLALPAVRQRVRTFESYAQSDIKTIYGPMLDKLSAHTVNHLDHTIFINQGTSLEASPLPLLAQLSPAFGIAVADFDNDGREDVFLSQNFFATSPGTHRYDAGRGLILRGNGNGSFESIPHHTSGVALYGEQRAAAIADFNRDGRSDLVVTQNGSDTKLFLNNTPKSGIRASLQGPPSNPAAIGAQLRLENAASKGPTREIHATSGWLSADSPVQVLSLSDKPTHLWIRWPGGKETRTPLPSDTTEVHVDQNGTIVP